MARTFLTRTAHVPRPEPRLFTLADSAPLFSGEWWVDVVGQAVNQAARLSGKKRAAVYLGAANGEAPEFYEMFVYAASRLGMGEACCRNVKAATDTDACAVVAEAALILLAGGDEHHSAWASFEAAALDAALVAAHESGSAVVGISAGAIHIGTHGFLERGSGRANLGGLYRGLGLVPFVFGAHEEAENWASLRSELASLGSGTVALGVPYGSTIAFYDDGSLEARPGRQGAAVVVLTNADSQTLPLRTGRYIVSTNGGHNAIVQTRLPRGPTWTGMC